MSTTCQQDPPAAALAHQRSRNRSAAVEQSPRRQTQVQAAGQGLANDGNEDWNDDPLTTKTIGAVETDDV